MSAQAELLLIKKLTLLPALAFHITDLFAYGVHVVAGKLQRDSIKLMIAWLIKKVPHFGIPDWLLSAFLEKSLLAFN